MSAVLKLLERQLGLAEMKRRLGDLGQRPGRWLEHTVAYGPCLLVSRERGSGGGDVARLAGGRLGWHVYDREIVDEIAGLANVRQRFIESVDPEVQSEMQDPWPAELAPEDIGLEPYLRCLRQVVLAFAHHGDVVIVGRGAQYLLPAKCALRVRVVAPLEWRVQRVADHHKVPLSKAQAHVQAFDAERTNFIQRCFQQDPNSSLNYDLTVNTAEIGVEAAAEIVLLALRDKLGVQPRQR